MDQDTINKTIQSTTCKLTTYKTDGGKVCLRSPNHILTYTLSKCPSFTNS